MSLRALERDCQRRRGAACDMGEGGSSLGQASITGVNVLFTSAGRRVELLRAFRRANQSLGLDGRIVALDADPLAPVLQVADRPYIVPRIDAPEYVSTLMDICRRERVNLIFPLIDPDVPILARDRGMIEATGARLAVVASEAAAITADKCLTAQFFRRLGLTTPRAWLPSELDPAAADYPLFIKPRFGSAAKGTFKVRNAGELTFFSGYVTQPIVQEYLPGPEITNDVICDLQGQVLAVVSRRRIEVRGGEVAKGITLHDPAITAACVEVARALPAIGPITVQCIMKNGVPHFTEINARLGGGVTLGIAAGADSPRLLLARAAGVPVEIPPLGSYQPGMSMSRFDDSFFLAEAQREQMEGHRL
jgi:carbamoyl-phosphate synthase large subunit